MKTKISLFFIFFIQILNAQIPFKGIIINSNNKPINRATIQLKNSVDNDVIDYTLSNELGSFEIKILNPKNSYLMVSAFGYDSQVIELENYTKKTNLKQIVLMEIEQLDEVVLSFKKKLSINKDSISYNISAIKNNTDKNLKDLVKKLPGLEISENGKVKFQGSTVNKVLVDGNDFFGNKHKIATENISIEMIEKISVLFNNNNNTLDKDFNENTKTDLNVTLKKNSHNKIKGNISANHSFKNQFKNQSNLFSFKKKGNISLILDYNNVGTNYLSVPDYIEMIGGIDNNSNKSIVSIDNYIPKFVYDDENFENKETKFSALNFTYNKDKFKINSTFFLNDIKQSKSEKNERFFLSNTTVPSIIENYFDTDKNLLLNGLCKIDYNVNEKSTLNSFTSFNFNKNDFINSVNNKFITNKINKSISFNEKIFYKQKIKKNFLFETKIIFDKKKYDDDLKISANSESILGVLNDSLNQVSNYDYTSIEFNNSILYRYKKSKYKMLTTLVNNSEYLVSDIKSLIKNEINRDVFTLKTGIDINQKISDKFSISALTNIITNKINNLNTKILIDYNFGINYISGVSSNLSFNYSSNYEIPKIHNLFSGFIVKDYLNTNSKSSISYDQFINMKNLEFSYSNYLQKAKLFISVNSSFSYADENITTNSNFIEGTYNYIDIVLGKSYNSFLTTIFMDKHFSKVPLKLRTVFLFKNINMESFIDNKSNKMSLRNVRINNSFISVFKNSNYQLELSQISNFNKNKQEAENSNFNFGSHTINLISKYTHNNLNAEIKIGKLWQYNLKNNIQQTLIGGNFSYVLNKSLTANITLENILNTDKYLFLSQTTIDNTLTNTINSKLSGYYLIGLKFKY